MDWETIEEFGTGGRHSGRLGMGRGTLGEVGMGWETLGEFWDG